MKPIHWIISIIFLSLTGCGYHWDANFPNHQRPTIAVPFVKGDEDGTLTAEIIRSLAALGIADIRTKKGDFTLEITILDTQDQTVGYRRDKQKISGEIKKNIVGCEGRKSMNAKVVLKETSSDQIIQGPFIISADTDYDYVDGDSIQDLAFINSEGQSITVLPFSLGQLESIESAQESATKPLYRKLAQKIADTIACYPNLKE